MYDSIKSPLKILPMNLVWSIRNLVSDGNDSSYGDGQSIQQIPDSCYVLLKKKFVYILDAIEFTPIYPFYFIWSYRYKSLTLRMLTISLDVIHPPCSLCPSSGTSGSCASPCFSGVFKQRLDFLIKKGLDTRSFTPNTWHGWCWCRWSTLSGCNPPLGDSHRLTCSSCL